MITECDNCGASRPHIPCPCCGAPLPNSGLWIDETTKSVVRNCKVARLPPTGFRLLLILWEIYPRGLPAERLRQRLWSHRADGGPECAGNLSAQVQIVRRNVEPLSMRIVVGRAMGGEYRLVLADLASHKRQIAA